MGGQGGAGHDNMVESEGKRLPGYQLQSKFDFMLAHWLPGKPTEGDRPLISYHSGDNFALKIEKITSWCGAGD